MSSSKSKKSDLKLEKAIEELELIVKKLESPDLPLEDSIELFEKGSELSAVCFEKLKAAEKKVELLVKKVPQPGSREDLELEDFDSDEV